MRHKILSVLTIGTCLILLLEPLVSRLSASQKLPRTSSCLPYSVIEKVDSTIFQVDCRGRVTLVGRGDTLFIVTK